MLTGLIARLLFTFLAPADTPLNRSEMILALVRTRTLLISLDGNNIDLSRCHYSRKLLS